MNDSTLRFIILSALGFGALFLFAGGIYNLFDDINRYGTFVPMIERIFTSALSFMIAFVAVFAFVYVLNQKG